MQTVVSDMEALVLLRKEGNAKEFANQIMNEYDKK